MTAQPLDQLLALQSAVAGRYSIEREIGRGGMGIVYLARDVALDRPVAIKLLPPARAGRPDLRRQFLREARTAARLSHPNIVPIFAVEEAGDFVFFVMAFIEGETLRRRVTRQGPLPAAAGVRVLRDLAWALGYAHAQGVVHRDVKPENILLESGTDRALVTDFGIATVGSGDGDGETAVVGTPEFMSPEQATGEPVDHRSDLYALGAVAIFTFSGRAPFEGNSAPAILAQHIAARPPATSSLAPGIPSRVAALIDQCLAKEPGDRVQTGEQIAEALALSLERRRELPPAVRGFIAERRAAEVRTAAYIAMAPWLLGLLLGLFFSGEPIAVLSGLGVVAVLFGWPLGQTVLSARRLLAAGHRRDDVVHGFEQELERRREELVVRFGKDHESASQRIRRKGTVAMGVAAAMLGVSWVGGAALFSVAPMALSLGVAGSVLLGLIGWHRAGQRSDRKVKQQLKFWRGPLGKLLFSWAGYRLEVRTDAPALTHRPTEVAIGMVVEGLFESLPKPTRAALGDLPGLARGLEADAQRMRERVQELDVLIAAGKERATRADGSATRSHAANSGDVRERLLESRTRAAGRLADAVGALERMRIDLLRLRAGAISLDGVTANLGNAREVSEQVNRLIAGYEEVGRALHQG